MGCWLAGWSAFSLTGRRAERRSPAPAARSPPPLLLSSWMVDCDNLLSSLTSMESLLMRLFCCEVVIFVIPCLILSASSKPVVHRGYKLLCILKIFQARGCRS